MSDYLHGAYGNISAAGNKVAATGKSAIVYVGTAPVHNIVGGSKNVNKPILVNSMAEAKKHFGYNDDWAKYTLCEAMHVHFENMGIGPIVLINVLDPAVNKAAEGGTASKTPSNGKVVIQGGQNIVLDSISITGKTLGTDYTVSYDVKTGDVTLMEKASGSLGTSALSISYDIADATDVDAADVIGSSDGEGLNKGLYAIKNVYQMTGYIPSYLVVPGFGEIAEVHAAMYTVCQKINGHFDAWMLTDIPLTTTNDGSTTTHTMNTAVSWKNTNNYNKENETVSFPTIKGTDDNIYHLSVLRAACLQKLLLDNDGIPYHTASNQECAIIENLYLGASVVGRIYDDEVINEKLNKNGIASAAYVGGRWALWGAHSADYNYITGDSVNVSETNRMMLYYISNDFQHRRMGNIDQPMTANDIKAIVAEEQARLDALVKIGALTYGEVHLDASEDAQSDMINGNYSFTFRVTTTPIAKSLTANVYWTSDGFVTYFNNIA